MNRPLKYRSLSACVLLCLILFMNACAEETSGVIASGKPLSQSPEPTIIPIPMPTPTPVLAPTPTPTPTPAPTPTPVPEVSDSPYGQNVERWREDVRGALTQYGLEDQEDRFMRVLWCESRGDPDARNQESGASGLMQHLPRYWDERAKQSGFQGSSPFNPIANIYTSVWLLDTGGWQHWECK